MANTKILFSDIVDTLNNGDDVAIPKHTQIESVAVVIDVSGSTGTEFLSKMSVLDKEIDIAFLEILKNPDNNYVLFAFDDKVSSYKINVLKEENMVDIYEKNLKPGGSTCTHLAFQKINQSVIKFNTVLLLTDGQTNSSSVDLNNETKLFNDKNIVLKVIAVSTGNIDLNIISHAEETRLPGMDLINILKNSISSLAIYSKFHKDVPYVGATSSKLTKNNLTFFDNSINMNIPVFLNKLMEKLSENSLNIEWGHVNTLFNKMLTQIGRLISALYISFPENHSFVNNMINTIQNTCGIDSMTNERILNMIKYGFNCTKNSEPIVFTNFEQHVKESTVKNAEFSDAVNSLKQKGTTLGCSKSICLPLNGMIIITNNNVWDLHNSLDSYPNSIDKYNNVFFGIDDNVNGQAIRIGMRQLCGRLGFKNSQGSPNVIFFVANEMSKCFVNGLELTNEEMLELRKLAIHQTSMENMIADKKYSGVGLYTQWKAGHLPQIHFSNTQTHTSLYTDIMINSLQLTEPLWWALMMSMLGIFNEQFENYKIAIMGLDIDVTNVTIAELKFLQYIRTTYTSKVSGKIQVVKLDTLPTSVITLDEFDKDDEVYIMNPHVSRDMYASCGTNTHYSKKEITDYVMGHGCVWCYKIPTSLDTDFTRVYLTDSNSQIETANTIAVPLKVNGIPEYNSMHVCACGCGNIGSCLGVAPPPIPKHHMYGALPMDETLIRINMIGITGSGKTTATSKIHDIIIAKKGACLCINADKHSKNGISGKNLQNTVKQEYTQFCKLKNKLKVVIIDICNESGSTSKTFGIDFSIWKTVDFYPNLDVTHLNDMYFNDYECWCLNNVLLRPIHTKDTPYWLNRLGAGLDTCIKVHNGKSSKLKQTLRLSSSKNFNINLQLDEITKLITEGSQRYMKYLDTWKLDDKINELVKIIN